MSLSLLLIMKNITDKVVEKIKTYILFSINFVICLPFVGQCGKICAAGRTTEDGMHMRVECWTPKSRNTHSE